MDAGGFAIGFIVAPGDLNSEQTEELIHREARIVQNCAKQRLLNSASRMDRDDSSGLGVWMKQQ